MSNDKRQGGRRPERGSGGRRGGGGGRKPQKSTANSGPVEPLKPTEDVPDIESFRHWDLRKEVFEALDEDNIVKPTPIQAISIGHVLEGRDVIARAQTGTGKTLAFAAPMLTKLDPTRSSVLALILSPTRELAEQIAKVFIEIGDKIGLKVALIVGGEPAQPQVAALQNGAQIVVGTPGRVLDLYGQKFLSFPWTEFAVLDEADEMLEIGFIDDIKEILSKTPDERQTLLFSATFPVPLLKLARDYTKNPVEVATVSGHATAETVTQCWFKIDSENDRAMNILRVLEQADKEAVFLIFCDRRVEVDRLFRKLERSSFSVKALHGGYEQDARFRVMDAFRSGDVKALIATDVASRGLDVKHVTHVINVGAPRDITSYTHRIGRTGRAGREGKAITIIAPPNMRNWSPILKEATWEIKEVDPPERTRSGGGRHGGGRGREERSDQPRRSRRREERTEETSKGEVVEITSSQPSREEAPKEKRDEEPRRRRGRGRRKPDGERAQDDSERSNSETTRRSDKSQAKGDTTERPKRKRTRRDNDDPTKTERSIERSPERKAESPARAPQTGGFGAGV
jgi:superfamily II DNA/RNA helicase